MTLCRQTIGMSVLALLWTLVAPAQTNKAISQKEQELQKLRAEIELFESKLHDSEKQERVTLDRLDNLEKQSTLIRKLLRNLLSQERSLTSQIDSAESSIGDLVAARMRDDLDLEPAGAPAAPP